VRNGVPSGAERKSATRLRSLTGRGSCPPEAALYNIASKRDERMGQGNGIRHIIVGGRVGRVGDGQPAVGEERQQGLIVRGRAGYARRQGAARESSIPIPAPPISTRAFTGRTSRSIPRSSRITAPSSARRCAKYEQARVLGGGSSINGQLANRGAPSDYDEWVSRGAAGWGWDAVLPYFKKVERDMDFDGPYHGKEGRIPVRRIGPDLWNGHAKAVAAAFKDAGFDFIEDQNGEFATGIFPITISNLYDRRRVGPRSLSRQRHAAPGKT